MSQNKWDKRYSGEEYMYGEEPNVYLKEKLGALPQGEILFAAEGEGRNAVFAAKSGWKVKAFDSSKIAKEKAEKLAERNQVQIEYSVINAEEVDFPKERFDALVLIYAHFPQNRHSIHQRLASFVKPGGYLILEAFNKDHVSNQQQNPKAGGPKDIEMLYDLEELKSDFKDFDFVELENKQIVLKEGEHHVGKADVIRILGVKR